jgi:hypothetical protein
MFFSRRLYKVRTNYLNNKDILKEIHRSKNSYCYYADPDAADYDMIMHNLNEITTATIEEAKQCRATRLAKLAQDRAVAEGIKTKIEDHAIDPTTIENTAVVFRVMTWEHIPVDDAKSRRAAIKAMEEEGIPRSEYDDIDIDISNNTKYVKVNFPPFEHYRVDAQGIPVCVGRSHWKGNLTDGHFSRDHGNMTPKLAHMFIKLCERYGTKGNWRNYTYNDEMRSQALLQLSQIGLQFDESKSLNPFSYYTAAVGNSFTRVLNIEKRNQNLRDDILEMNNLTPSYTRQGMGSGNHYDSSDE